jgi:hypothetical protein
MEEDWELWNSQGLYKTFRADYEDIWNLVAAAYGKIKPSNKDNPSAVKIMPWTLRSKDKIYILEFVPPNPKWRAYPKQYLTLNK